MNHLMACRVCLAYDIRLHSISGQLRDIYEKFTETSLETGDTKPTCVCYICFSLLKKFQKFIEKSKKSDQLLEQMLNFGLELSVNSLDLFREQQTGIPWTLGKAPMVKVISATEEEVNMETPIKTEYDSVIDMGDQNEGFKVDPEVEHERIDTLALEIDLLDMEEPLDNDLYGIPVEDINQESSSDSKDNMPLQNISKQWKADRHKKISKVSLKRSNVSKMKTCKILKPDAREIFIFKEEQLQQMPERSKSQSYQYSPFKCDLCCEGFVDTKDFENHQETHAEVLHLPKKRKSDNETEKETLKSRVPLNKTDKFEENKAQNEEISDFKMHNKKIKTIIPNNETTTSNINSDKNNSKIEANSNERVTAPNSIFICDVCKKEYHRKSLLENHVKKRHLIGICSVETQYKCSYCSKSFNGGAQLDRHLRIHTGEKPYKCSFCTKCFTQSGNLNRHVRIHTRETPYKCSHCTKCFFDNNYLAIHVRTHTGEKPYKCSYCTKCFTQSSHLVKHVRIHTGEKPYKCSYCTKCFTQGGDLAIHVRIHTGEKPYKCSYCTKCFTQGSDLAKHVRIHTGEKPYKCSYCMKCFTHGGDLAIHVRIHTGEKPYKCSYCTKCFTQSSHLVKHVRIHTGEKPYKCSYCTKCFTQGGDLAIHVRIHTGEKPYKCRYCTKCFTQSCDLTKHVRNHKGEKDIIL